MRRFSDRASVGIDVRVAYDVLEMPLHGVYPALQIEPVLDLVTLVRVADGCLDVILDVVVADGLVEDGVTMLCERHICCFVVSGQLLW